MEIRRAGYPGAAKRRGRSWSPYLLLAPALLVLLVFTILPSLFVFVLSFFHWSFSAPPRFVGGRHFQEMFRSATFWHALRVTFLYGAAQVVASTGLGLVVANLIAGVARGRGFYRTAYLLPYVLPLVSTSLVWLWIFQPQFGILNDLLGLLHLPGPGWTESRTWALPSIIIYTTWHDLGFSALILTAGLLNVPSELKEAARIDGASERQIFWRITWPLLSPTLIFVVLITTISSFKAFTQIFQLTGGGPLDATTVLSFLIYLDGFQFFRFGYAAAVAVVLFLLLLLLTGIELFVTRRRIHYG